MDEWVSKPVLNVESFLDLVDREALKASLRMSLAAAEAQGLPLQNRLHEWARQNPSIPVDLLKELEEEFYAKVDLLPLQAGEEPPDVDMEAIAGEIDALYDQIRDLIAERGGDPGLKAAVEPLREKLRELQEQEADAMEFHFRSKIAFDPREGRRLLKEIERVSEE